MNPLEAFRKLYDLEGRVAVVAGGAGGIGRAICDALAAFGATVVVCGRTESKAVEAAAEIEAAGGRAWGAALDILKLEQMDAFVEQVMQRSGRLDILVNSAGTHIESTALEFPEEIWDTVIDLNLKGAFFLSQAVAKVQIPQGGGKQIQISSVRSQLGIRRGYAAYCCSKGGLNLMIKQLATEWGKYNIMVNGIAPTFTRTELVRSYLEDPNFYNPLVARIPLGRICEPMDLGAAAVYLAAPASDFITGQILFADGGITASQ